VDEDRRPVGRRRAARPEHADRLAEGPRHAGRRRGGPLAEARRREGRLEEPPPVVGHREVLPRAGRHRARRLVADLPGEGVDRPRGARRRVGPAAWPPAAHRLAARRRADRPSLQAVRRLVGRPVRAVRQCRLMLPYLGSLL
jgi:hypothetical protein